MGRGKRPVLALGKADRLGGARPHHRGSFEFDRYLPPRRTPSITTAPGTAGFRTAAVTGTAAPEPHVPVSLVALIPPARRNWQYLTMTTRFCPYCKSNSDLMPRWASTTPLGRDRERYEIFTVRMACVCANCKNLSTAKVVRTRTNPGGDIEAMRKLTALSSCEWAPTSASSPEYPHVPAHVARCASEAHMSHGIGADAASILMTRTTIEATAKSKGIENGTLFSKIEAMSAQNVIRPATLRLAHAIRVLGNDMAHGDVDELPTSEDAADALHLMDLILEEVYQATAIADEILARRTARGEGAPTSPTP